MTIFEKIINRDVPAKIIYESDDLIAFHDVDPKAPIHILIVPKHKLVRLADASEDDALMLGKLIVASKKVASDLGVLESGYRLVINNGPDAGESVSHLHVHLLGGRPLAWPPG